MSYSTQKGVLNRLEAESRKAGRRLEDRQCEELGKLWAGTKADIEYIILQEYRRDFGTGLWHTAEAHAKGTLPRIRHRTLGCLSTFYIVSYSRIKTFVRESYLHELARQLWMLDCLTPRSVQPALPSKVLREASAKPGDSKSGWETALAEWVEAYHSNLMTNLRLEALHEGDIDSAAMEVNATKVGGHDPAYKFSSFLIDQILQTQRDARSDVAEENGDIVAEEIFQTMEDGRVCEDCDSQDGKPIEEVDMSLDHIFGFRCRCFTRIVPVGFADLLRNGDEAERQAALTRDALGLVPDAMAIVDPETGKLKAHAMLSFDEWMGGERGINIMGVAGSRIAR